METLALVLVVLGTAAVAAQEVEVEAKNNTDQFEETLKQVVWKKCALQLTPTCLKLSLARMVDRLTEDTHFQPLPGVLLTSNRSRALHPPEVSRSDLSLQQRLDSFLLHKVAGYLRSLTLSVRLLDLPTFNSTDLLDNVIARVTGRKNKGGGAGVGALAMMMGGAMMTMMMSGVAAMAGKALMTAMMALMLSAMGAMKSHGHGGKSTTYEIISQPEVSHAHSHSSEVLHGHGWKRSLDSHQLMYHSMAS